MKIRSVRINPGGSSKQQEIVRRTVLPVAVLVFAVAGVLVTAAALASSGHLAIPRTSPSTSIPNVKCVIGLANIKPNTRGTLSLLPSGLEFATDKKKADISTASIQDILTGQESRQDVSGPAGTLAKAAIPYGGGRIVSLFSHQVEVLTVEYTDANGGFHGTVFVLASSKATALRDQLVAQGAKVTPHVQPPAQKEQKP